MGLTRWWIRLMPILVAACGLVCSVSAHADHITKALDVAILRPDLPGVEGYLNFKTTPGPSNPYGGGEERTGWTDRRHPALNGPADNSMGYDRSDHMVNVRTTTLTDPTQPAAGQTVGVNRPDDFRGANRAWQQTAGISIVERAHRDVNVPAGVTFPITGAGPDERQTIFNALNNGNQQLEVYYGRNPDGTLGVTRIPNGTGGGTRVPNNTGIIMDNVNNPNGAGGVTPGFIDTLAHELEHFLADGQAVHMPVTAGAIFPGPVPPASPADPAHSIDPRNVVADGAIQWSPGMPAGGATPVPPAVAPQPPFAIPSATDALTNGAGEPVMGRPMSTGPGGAPRTGGVDEVTIPQVRRVYDTTGANGATTYLQRPNDHDSTFGDRADFDWVEDSFDLEDAFALGNNNADNHGNAAGTNGTDFLVFEIAPALVGASNHLDTSVAGGDAHQHSDWGELVRAAYNQPFFRTVDVFSQIARYSDSDIDDTGFRSRRESALDYKIPEFSADQINWFSGTLVNVFTRGWTDASVADDYVARWLSPIDATFVRIQAVPGPIVPHDRNVQIDAILATMSVATSVPEPSSLALLGVAGLGLVGYTYRRRQHMV